MTKTLRTAKVQSVCDVKFRLFNVLHSVTTELPPKKETGVLQHAPRSPTSTRAARMHPRTRMRPHREFKEIAVVGHDHLFFVHF